MASGAEMAILQLFSLFHSLRHRLEVLRFVDGPRRSLVLLRHLQGPALSSRHREAIRFVVKFADIGFIVRTSLQQQNESVRQPTGTDVQLTCS